MKSDTIRILAFRSKSYYNTFGWMKGRKEGREGAREGEGEEGRKGGGRKEEREGIWQEIFLKQNFPKIFYVFKKY